MIDTPAEHLTRAKAVLVKFGWRQGTKGGIDATTCCAIEALERTKRDEVTCYLCSEIFARTVGVSGGTFGVITWNDQFGRTQADVEEAYDKAINLAKEQNRAEGNQE